MDNVAFANSCMISAESITKSIYGLTRNEFRSGSLFITDTDLTYGTIFAHGNSKGIKFMRKNSK